MPITRRKRANPPDQPENNNNHSAESTETISEAPVSAVQSEAGEREQTQPVTPPTDHVVEAIARPSLPVETQAQPPVQPTSPPVTHAANGERAERQAPERQVAERQEHIAPSIESGRRTPRGELFRRPPQVPPQAVSPISTPAAAPVPPLQPPAHEISLPLGNLLHLAYNPGYTGAEESRSQLLQQLAQESKNGGRARCWNCGSLAIVYDRWNTRSKTFGEVGVAICEICGVWSVM